MDRIGMCLPEAAKRRGPEIMGYANVSSPDVIINDEPRVVRDVIVFFDNQRAFEAAEVAIYPSGLLCVDPGNRRFAWYGPGTWFSIEMKPGSRPLPLSSADEVREFFSQYGTTR